RRFTTFYWIADDNDAGRRPEEWSFDPAHPAWSAFSNAIQNGTDPVDYVYRPWGAFNRPPRWPWHPHHGTVVTYSSPDGVVHAPPSLALTLRQATCQRLDWRLCRGLGSLPRAAGPALCCPPPAHWPGHHHGSPGCRSRSRTPRPPPGAARPATHRSTASLADSRSHDPGRTRPPASCERPAPGASGHDPGLAPRAGPSALGGFRPPPGCHIAGRQSGHRGHRTALRRVHSPYLAGTTECEGGARGGRLSWIGRVSD